MKNPNILFFLPDQHRFDWLGANSSLPLRTPNLDRLAQTGITFNRAYCPSPLCAPSRASLASGRNYFRCGVPNNDYNYPLEQPTYYQSLRDAGYRVAGVGKFDLHKDTSSVENLYWGLDGSHLMKEWGFTEGIDNEGKCDGIAAYKHFGEPRGPYLEFLKQNSAAETYINGHYEYGRKYKGAYVSELTDEQYCDNWIAKNGMDFLRGFPQNKPWHLVVNFCGPHSPMDITKSMDKKTKGIEYPLPSGDFDDSYFETEDIRRLRRNYAAMIENIDSHIGAYIDLLRERGELENTLLVYSSDHGEMLGDSKLWGKKVPWEASVRIPLIVSGPGCVSGTTTDALVSLHDLAATFIELAGSKKLPNMDAISIAPVLRGETNRHRNYVISALDNWKSIIFEKYKVTIGNENSPELYNLENDPAELNNLAEKFPEAVSEVLSLLVENSCRCQKVNL